MRIPMRLAVALGLVLASASAFAQNSDDELQIRAIIAGFSDIWARADNAGMPRR